MYKDNRIRHIYVLFIVAVRIIKFNISKKIIDNGNKIINKEDIQWYFKQIKLLLYYYK